MRARLFQSEWRSGLGKLARGALPALPFVIIGCVLLGPALFGGQALFQRDIFHNYWPTWEVVKRAVFAGHLPAWDPSQQSGIPLLADPHVGIFYPPNLLYFFLSFPRAYAWLVLFHLVVSGLGMRLWARGLEASETAALLCGLVYCLCGYVIGLIPEGPMLAGAAWIPWVPAVLLLPKPWTRRGLAAALVLSLQGLCGDPQSVIFSAICALGLVVWCRGRRRELLRALLLGLGLSALLAGVQLLPAWELLRHSTRSSGTPMALAWSFRPSRILELFAPWPFGGFINGPNYWPSVARGPAPVPFAFAPYLGAGAITLAILGLRRARSSGIALSLIVCGFLFALGRFGPLAWCLTQVPPFDYFRYPAKYLILVSLGLALLAGFGLERLHLAEARIRTATIACAAGTFLIIALAPTVAAASSTALWTALLQSVGIHAPADALATLSSSVLQAGSFAGCIVLLWAIRRRLSVRLLGVFTLLLVTGDLLLAAQLAIGLAPGDLYRWHPPAVDALTQLTATHPSRYLRDTKALRTGAGPDRATAVLLRRRARQLDTLKPNLSGVFGLEDAGGYAVVSLKRWNTVALALWPTPDRYALLVNACLVLTSPDGGRYRRLPGFHLLRSFPKADFAILAPKRCGSRLRSVVNVEHVGTLDEAVARLTRTDFDLLTQATAEGISSKQYSPASVTLVQSSPQRLLANVHATGTGAYLLFSNSWYPGWQALVDGTPTPIHITDGASIGFEVPRGDHRIELRFADPMLPFGATASILGLLLAALIAIVSRGPRLESSAQRKSRREKMTVAATTNTPTHATE